MDKHVAKSGQTTVNYTRTNIIKFTIHFQTCALFQWVPNYPAIHTADTSYL